MEKVNDLIPKILKEAQDIKELVKQGYLQPLELVKEGNLR